MYVRFLLSAVLVTGLNLVVIPGSLSFFKIWFIVLVVLVSCRYEIYANFCRVLRGVVEK